MRTLRSLALLLPLTLLAGCFEYSEEVTLHAGGGATMLIDMSVESELFEGDDVEEIRGALEEAKRELESLDQVDDVDVNDYVEGTMQHFVLDIAMNDREFLSELAPIRTEVLENGNLDYVRGLAEGSGFGFRQGAAHAVRQSITAEVTDNTPVTDAKTFEGREYFLEFAVHAPKVISSTGEVTGGTARWKFPAEGLGSSAEIPQQLHAEVSLAGSNTLLIVGGAGVLVFGLLFLWLRKKWARRWE
ncbi:hypothetical protein OAX78_01830 [Planctomycetota bacterium]|nr:hypothetical protein [Planctomycetota bacterium]